MVKVSKLRPGKIKKKIKPHRQKDDILDRIRPIGFDSDNFYIKLLLYGESGSGKTTFWSKFPGKILALTVRTGDDDEEMPEEFRSIDTPENRKRIDFFNIAKSEELPEIVDKVRSRYETIVLDHVSGFQDLVLKEILGLDEIPEQKSWGLAQQADYGECTMMCKTYFNKLLKHPKNVVFIAHQRVFGGDEESLSTGLPVMIGAELMPKLARWLNGKVSYIGQMFKRQKEVERVIEKKVKGKLIKKIRRTPGKGVEFCLRIADENHLYMTKFRKPVELGPVPDLIKDPTYAKLLKLIKEKRA